MIDYRDNLQTKEYEFCILGLYSSGMINRFIPKETALTDISVAKVKNLEDWLNNYSRRILSGVIAK